MRQEELFDDLPTTARSVVIALQMMHTMRPRDSWTIDDLSHFTGLSIRVLRTRLSELIDLGCVGVQKQRSRHCYSLLGPLSFDTSDGKLRIEASTAGDLSSGRPRWLLEQMSPGYARTS
jgi:uncharacterized protein YjfI (DUF2170 family)